MGGGALAFEVKEDMSLPVPAVRLGWLTPAGVFRGYKKGRGQCPFWL